jgi:uncharacterized protein
MNTQMTEENLKGEVTELKVMLENWFGRIKKAVIALSGGIDSSLVAFVAQKQLDKEHVIAVISASASVKMKELTDARNFCRQFDITLIEIDADEISNPEYRKNPVNRCFFCKSALYSELDSMVASRYPGYTVLNGNNFSDMGDFRPGLQAADEHRVLSPLAECNFTKEDIRSLARFYGLPNWNKPASPCLSSRFPYGEAITAEKLKMVEKAENLLNEHGFEDVRVRYIKNSARIEVPIHEMEKLKIIYSDLEPSILSVGFDTCEIDNEGLVSGKLNRTIRK